LACEGLSLIHLLLSVRRACSFDTAAVCLLLAACLMLAMLCWPCGAVCVVLDMCLVLVVFFADGAICVLMACWWRGGFAVWLAATKGSQEKRGGNDAHRVDAMRGSQCDERRGWVVGPIPHGRSFTARECDGERAGGDPPVVLRHAEVGRAEETARRRANVVVRSGRHARRWGREC